MTEKLHTYYLNKKEPNKSCLLALRSIILKQDNGSYFKFTKRFNFINMNIEIITQPLELDTYGFSGIALNGDYSGTAFKLMDKMWQIVKANGLGNKGKNIWIYEQGHAVFAGVELDSVPDPGLTLEHKSLHFGKYAYYKHTGSYSLIKQAGQAMKDEITKKGFETTLPYVEIYGHWTNDESKLETELIMYLK